MGQLKRYGAAWREAGKDGMPGKVFFQVEQPEEALKPGECRPFLRKTLAAAFPVILQGFVNEAMKGSCQHLKMVTELTRSQKREGEPRGKGPAELMLEELERGE